MPRERADSTPLPESCKGPSHELVQARRTFGSPRLSPRQPQGSVDPRRAGVDRGEGPGGLYLRGSGALGGGQPGGALSAFPRPRRVAGRRGATRLRCVRDGAGGGVGWRASGRVHRLRSCRQGLSALRQDRAGLLFGDVRGRHPAGGESGIARGRGARLCGAAHRRRAARGHHAGAETAAGPDDGAPHLGDVAGIASLFGRGDAAKRALPMSPEDLLEAAVLVYLRGLGLDLPGTR